MKLVYQLLALLMICQASAEVERLIDRPLTVKSFHQTKGNFIGARVAIAAYYFPHLEGSWIGETKEKPHEHTIKVKRPNGVSCFTTEGEKIFELELSSYGVPCFAYGTVKKGKHGYHIELDSVYEVLPDDPEWLKAYEGDIE